MRVSLFITCFNDTLFPQTGRAVVRLLERLGHTVEFPMDQTCCGQMHYNTGYQREAIPLVRRFVEVFGDAEVVVSPLGLVRGDGPRDVPARRRAGRRRRSWPRPSSALAPRVLRALGVPRQQAGGRGRRGLLPAPGDVSPDLPLAADAPGGRCAAAAAAGGPRDRPGRAAAGRGVLRVRRHVRGQERRHVDGHARRQAPLRPRHPGRGLRRGRQLVPDAHRRGPASPAGRRGRDPPRRDPRLDRRRRIARAPAEPDQEHR